MKKLQYILVLLAATLFSADIIAQTPIAIGPQINNYNSTRVRGYHYTAPINFVICGLYVPDDLNTQMQHVEVVRFTAGAPPAFPGTTNNFVSLFYQNNYAPNNMITCNIPVNNNDIMGVYGARGNGTTMFNSYGATQTNTTVYAQPMTLYRSGMQFPLNNQQMHDIWSEVNYNIGRIIMYIDCCNMPTLTTDSVDVLCNGDLTGEGTVHATGGLAPYTYQWDANANNQTDSTATGLGAGTYYVTVTTADNCTAIDSVTVNEPAALTVAMVTNSSQCGAPDGDATVTIGGGVTPYTYLWDANANNQTTNTSTGLVNGQYYVTVTDDNGCTIIDTADISLAIVNITMNMTFTEPLCNGNADGTATATPTNGNGPYLYDWSSGGNTDTENGLTAGTYYVTVTDNFGCTGIDSVLVTEPLPITVNAFEDDTICQTEDAFIYAQANGGDGNYVWDWNNGQYNNDTITPTPNTLTTYTVSVTDGNNCPGATATVTITVRDFMSLSTSNDTVICLGDSAFLSASATGGDGNYTYTWDNGIGPDNDLYVKPASTTTYHVTVNDGCSTPIVVDSITVVVGNYANPSFYAENASGCAPLEVTFHLDTVINGFTYNWDFGDGDDATSFSNELQHTYNLNGDQAECYDVALTVTTNYGCVTDVVYNCMVNVFPSPIADFTMDPIIASNLDPVIEFFDMSMDGTSWQYNTGDGQGSDSRNFSHEYADTGTYTVTQIVKNDFGCRDTIQKDVMVDFQSTIYIPNAFSPNTVDGINDGFKPVLEGVSSDEYLFTIYDRWGVIIFTTTDPTEYWNGKWDNTGKELPQGVYVYYIQYKHFDGLKNEVRGHVTLIK